MISAAPLYTLYVFVDGVNGCFRCKAHDAEQRLKTIRERGYLRKAPSGFSEWHPPHKIRYVSIGGPTPESAVEDEYLPPIEEYTVTWIDKWPDLSRPL